jgi:putative ABC transport system permease protein
MLKLNIRLAFRSLIKNKTTSFINLTGLAVSFSAVLLIVLYIQNELSYDRYHTNADRIYRISRESLDSNGKTEFHFGHTQPSLAIYLKKDFEEVKDAVRLINNGNSLVAYNQKSNVETRLFFADESVFSVFSWKLVKGNNKTALKETNSIAISQTTASRYFGEEDPIGKMLLLDSEHPLLVTAVFEDFPANSHIKADLLCSMSTLEKIEGREEMMKDQSNNYATYVLLRPNSSIKQLESKMGEALDKYYPLNQDGRKLSEAYRYHTWPLKKLHLYYTMDSETEPNGNYVMVYIFTATAILILLIACINFINLSTARLSQRAKEVGLKKVIGAQRSTLFLQFISEAFISGLLSLVFACVAVYFLLPEFNAFLNKSFYFSMLVKPEIIVALFLLLLVVGFVSGGYPALLLSSFKPAEVLKKGVATSWRKFSVRSVLVGVQFFFSISLIAFVIIVRSQLDFVTSFNPGYDKNNVLVLPSSDAIFKKFKLIKEQLEQQPGVKKVSMGSRVPSGRLADNQDLKIEKDGQFVPFDIRLADVHVDHDYIKTLGLQIAAGRDFDYQMASDSSEAFIINETAVRGLGWKSNGEAIGKVIQYGSSRKGNIIGVVKDINFESLHEQIKPFVLVVTRGRTRSVIVRIDASKRDDILKYLTEQWTFLRPGFPFSCFSLSDNFEKSYEKEVKLSKGINFFALFAVLISSLGVFGLALFMAEQRAREMGIRKVLGATASSIMLLFGKWFVVLILIAALSALPLSYWAAHQWLKNFAFATSIGFTPFIIAIATILLCTLFSISMHILRTATRNPVEDLRDE